MRKTPSETMFRLWKELSDAVASTQQIPEYDPSVSKFPAVLAAWQRITAPEHLEELSRWQEHVKGSNARAQDVAARALDECRLRQHAMAKGET
jgi:hypothetical protein